MDPNRPSQQLPGSAHQYDRAFPVSHLSGMEGGTDVREVLPREGPESEEGEEESPASSDNIARSESQNTGTGDESMEDQDSPQNSDSDAIMEDPRDSGSEYVPESSSPVDEGAPLSSDRSGGGADNQGRVEHQEGILAPRLSISAPATPMPAPSLTDQRDASQAQENFPVVVLREQIQGDISGSENRSDQMVPDPSLHIFNNRGPGSPYFSMDTTSSAEGALDPEEDLIGRDNDQVSHEIAPPAASYTGVGAPFMGNTPASPNAGSFTQIPRDAPLPRAQDEMGFPAPIDQGHRHHPPPLSLGPPPRGAQPLISQYYDWYNPSMISLMNSQLMWQRARGQISQSQYRFPSSGIPPSGHGLGGGQQVTRPPFTRSDPNPFGNSQQNPHGNLNPGINQSVPFSGNFQNPNWISARGPGTPGLPANMQTSQPFHGPHHPYRNPGIQNPDTNRPIYVPQADPHQEARNRAEEQRQRGNNTRYHLNPEATPFYPTNYPSSAQNSPFMDRYGVNNPFQPLPPPPSTTHSSGWAPGQNASVPQQRFPPLSNRDHSMGNRPAANNAPMAPQQPVLPPHRSQYDSPPYAPPNPENYSDDNEVIGPSRPRGAPILPSHDRSPTPEPPTVPSNTEPFMQRQPRQQLRDYQSYGAEDLDPLVQENRNLATTNVAPTVNHADPGDSDFEPKKKRAWCRMHAEHGFQVSELKEGPWRKAIRHDTIRKTLLEYATRRHGAWKHHRERGSHPLDQTSVHPDQQDWDEANRATWPDILFQFQKRRNEELQHTEPLGPWMWGDRFIVDRDNRPLTNWPRLNTCCSTRFEGWAMEALFRFCSKLSPVDIWQRTMPVTYSSKKGKDAGRTAYNARRDRFRKRSGLIAWTKRPGSEAIYLATLDRIGQWGRDNNSTRDFEGFTKEEFEKIVQDSKASRKGGKASKKSKTDDEPEESDEDEIEERTGGEEPGPEEEEDDDDPDVIDVEGDWGQDFEGYE